MTTLRTVASLLALAVSACDGGDPASAVLENAYPVQAVPAQQTAVLKAWWSVVEFPEPVAAGESSEEQRVIAASDYAYVLLAPGWDPQSNTPPAHLLAVRTTDKVTAHRGKQLRIVISSATVSGDCSMGSTLSQADADFITQRIFPREFEGLRYDAATCTTSALPASDAATQ